MSTLSPRICGGFRLLEPWKKIGSRTLARAEKDSRALYITRDGQRAFSSCFEFVGRFVQVGNQCIARAKENGRWRHIDEWGHRIYVRKTYASAGDFREVEPGLFLARVQGCRSCWFVDDKAYHIRPTGQPQYEERFDFVGHYERYGTLVLAVARIGKKEFCIDIHGKMVRCI